MLKVTDQNYQDIIQRFPYAGVKKRILRYGSPEAINNRMIPFEDVGLTLIPEDEWKDRIIEANEKRTLPIHYFQEHGVPAKNQGRTNYCWAYGCASVIEHRQLHQGAPYCRLAPATLGWLVSYRDQGNYLSSAIKGANERGVASSRFADDGTTNPRTFKPGWEADALLHRSDEWIDTNASREKLMVQQCLSILLSGSPLYIAYNWWRHALMMVGVKWTEGERYNLTWQDWNSHLDGLIELTGSRGVPDEAYGLGSATFANAT